jgi:hypothetical protein
MFENIIIFLQKMSSGKNFSFNGFKLSKSQSSQLPDKSAAAAPYQTSAKPSYGSSFSRQHKTEEE